LVAAPIFHDIAKRILETDLSIVPNRKKIQRDTHLIDELMADIKSNSDNLSRSYLNVAPKTEKNIQRRFSSANKTIMPNLVNQSMRDATALLNEIGLEYRIVGNGKVVSQSIEPGAHISRDSICTLKCEQTEKIKSIRMY
jgi:hypothetical protein